MATTIRGSDNFDTAPDGLGKVLQVVQSTYNTEQVLAGGTGWVDVNLDVSITPTSASSKFLIMLSVNSIANSTSDMGVKIRRVTASDTSTVAARTRHGYSNDSPWTAPMIEYTYLDSPNTTETITYDIQGRLGSGTWEWYAQSGASDNINKGTLVVMEIAQ